MNLLESAETTNFKERDIEIAYVLKLEMADGHRRQWTCCPKTATEYTMCDSKFKRFNCIGFFIKYIFL
jgi:hypothetical protein